MTSSRCSRSRDVDLVADLHVVAVAVAQVCRLALELDHGVPRPFERAEPAVVPLPRRQPPVLGRRLANLVDEAGVPRVLSVDDRAEARSVSPGVQPVPALLSSDMLAHGSPHSTAPTGTGRSN